MYWHKNNNLADTEFVGYTISTQKSSRLSCTVCLLFDVKKSERGHAGICQTENSFSAPMTFSHKPCSVKLNTKYSNWKQCGISLLPEKYNTLKIQQLLSFSSLFLWGQLHPQDTWPKHLSGSIPACVSLLQILDPKGEYTCCGLESTNNYCLLMSKALLILEEVVETASWIS